MGTGTPCCTLGGPISAMSARGIGGFGMSSFAAIASATCTMMSTKSGAIMARSRGDLRDDVRHAGFPRVAIHHVGEAHVVDAVGELADAGLVGAIAAWQQIDGCADGQR